MAKLSRYQESKIARMVNRERKGDKLRIAGGLWECTDINGPDYRHREGALLTFTRQIKSATYNMQISYCPWTQSTYIFKSAEALQAA
jgi:hypothetical protein